MKIIIDSAIPYIHGVLEEYADVSYIAGSDITHSDVKTCDAMIIRTRTKCNKELLNGSSVKFIASATIGYDHIDMDYCKSQGIEIALSSGCNANAVAQWVLASLFEIDKTSAIEPSKTTIGIIGVGNVGSAVANLFSELGFLILMNDPPKKLIDNNLNYVDLDYLLSNSDIITLHTPLIKNGKFPTNNLIRSKEFDKMKKGAIFINASRGEVVDEGALMEAIKNNTISTAILDVYINEPYINTTLINLAKITTPHIAGYSINGKANGTSMAIRALANKFDFHQLKSWYPKDIEGVIDNVEMSFSNTKRLMPLFYSILNDSDTLKKDSSKFEYLRNNYIYRKEFF